MFMQFFQHIFFLIWLSWFLFGLGRMFQVHDTTINFSFSFIHSFFSFFVNSLLWATLHVVDGFPTWSISSHVRIVLKRLAFGSRLLVSFLLRGKIWLKSILEKWVISGQCALRHQSMWFQNITIPRLVFQNQLSVYFKNSSFFVTWFLKNKRKSF